MTLRGDTDVSLFLLTLAFVFAISVFMYFYTRRTPSLSEKELNGNLLEKRTADQLQKLFGTRPTPNVILEYPGGSTEIDMVHVTKKGIFVIECKYRTNQVSGDATSDHWRVIADGKEIAEMYNPIKQNANHIKSLESYLKKEKQIVPKVYNVVVVTAKKLSIKKINQVDGNVILVQGLSDLKKLKELPDTISSERASSLQAIIGKKESTEYQRRKHVKYIKNKY